ncbi:MAG: hypothetical protein ACE3JK_10780 [Sporolactobacillus sp.]
MKIWKTIVLIISLFIIGAVSYIVGLLYFKGSYLNDYNNFISVLFGSILGGLFTILGVQIEFESSRKKELAEKIPDKIITIDIIIDSIISLNNEFREFSGLAKNTNQDIDNGKIPNGGTPQQLLAQKLLKSKDLFATKLGEITHECAKIDSQTYHIARSFNKKNYSDFNRLYSAFTVNLDEIPNTYIDKVNEMAIDLNKFISFINHKLSDYERNYR